MQFKKVFIIVIALVFSLSVFAVKPATCDKGVVPFGKYITIFEPGQKAIIGWNGSVEVLILSNDLMGEIVSPSEFKGEVQVLEILPLPSLPKIEKGSEESFRTLVNYINSRISRKAIIRPAFEYAGLGEKVIIEFQITIGPHFITVVRADSGEDLEKWIISYAHEHGLEKPEVTKDVFEDYIRRGYKYFVIDIVTIKELTGIKTIAPLVYIFKSDRIYYPLKISSLSQGHTKIKLFIVSKERIRSEPVLKAKFEFIVEDVISLSKLEEVDSRLANLFKENELWVTVLEYGGSTLDLSSDLELTTTIIVLRGLDSIIAFATPIILTIISLAILLHYYFGKSPFIEYSKPGYVITSASLLILLGVLLTIPYIVLALRIIELPILPYIKSGIGKMLASLIIGIYIGLGILALTSVVLMVKKKMLGLKLGLASALSVLIISVIYASIIMISGFFKIYYAAMGITMGLGALSSIIALLSLIFIGLSWNYIIRK
ncbi:MAG: hypothetical protein DRO23_03535 [Thermoprotei archaeon]|nr:MAG: hypothetical protein DRO23_03535 [Thermoprotei archaeon]